MRAHSIFPLALRRSMAGKGMLAVVALGVLMAATLLASAPVYARAMSDLGLTHAIREDIGPAPNIDVQLASVALATNDGTATQAAVERRIGERVGWFRGSELRSRRLGRFNVAQPGQALPVSAVQGQPLTYSGAAPHVRVVEGRLPAAGQPGEPLEVAVSARGAAETALKVGDTFELRDSFDTCERPIVSPNDPPPPPCVPAATATLAVAARLVAIIAPADAADPYWAGSAERVFEPYRLDLPDVGFIVPMLADDAAVDRLFASPLPAYRAAVTWRVLADPEKLNRGNYKRAAGDITALANELKGIDAFASSPLADTLDHFDKSSDYRAVPLDVLLLEITAIALFYVAHVSAIMVERQGAEIALLRSRGASVGQVVTIYFWQGVLISLPAMLVAPFLAAAATAALGWTPAFADVSGGDLLPVTIVPLAFAGAAAGAALSVLALLLPAVVAARLGALAQRRTEARPRPSVLQRYYLDFALAAVAVFVLFELDQRGSVYEPSSGGGLSSDPLLLASPALVVAAAGALMLRFYPIVLRLTARFLGPSAGASAALGLAQVARNPAQYTRLTLLLMMAVALGTFGASYTSTADRSYADRASYDTGSDIRVTQVPLPASTAVTPQLDAKFGAIAGVARATTLVRTNAGFSSPGAISQGFQLLGVDPQALRDLLWWRGDFADRSLGDLMAELASFPAVPGRPIGGRPATISVWVRGDPSLTSLTLWARFRDARGEYGVARLGGIPATGDWTQLSAPIASESFAVPEAPLNLVSLVASEPAYRFVTAYAPLLVDDVTVSDASGAVSVVEDFESGLHWSALPSTAPQQDAVALSTESQHGGRVAAQIILRPGGTTGLRGMFSTSQTPPLAALVSESTGLRAGMVATLLVGRRALVPIAVRGTFRLFPTAPSSSGPVVVVDRDQLGAWADAIGFTDTTDLVPTEALLSLRPGAPEAPVIAAAQSITTGHGTVLTRSSALGKVTRDPLVAASGSGILSLAFAAALLLVAAALLVSLLTAVGRRRVEFAVARSMGLSAGQVLRMLALEYATVAIAGTSAGAALGVLVGRRMLGFLDVTELGAKVEPGFILQTEWPVVAAGVGGVLVSFAAVLAVAVRAVARIAGASALRTE